MRIFVARLNVRKSFQFVITSQVRNTSKTKYRDIDVYKGKCKI